MGQAIKAGALYFALVFAVGFVLGALRVLVVAPRIGELAAVALELPLMLTASWLACGFVLRRFQVDARPRRRGAMGATAFALLMLAELALSMALGRTLAQYFAAYASLAGLLGLVGQLAFAAFPLARR